VIETIRSQWAEWALNAETVVIIGARPIPAEGHVWKPVLDSIGKVFYVGGASTGLEQLKEKLGSRIQVVGVRFREALPSIVSALK